MQAGVHSGQVHQGLLRDVCYLRLSDYDTVKHKGVSYNIGDTVEIFSTQINTTYVAKLKRIVKVPTSFEKLPFVEVQWYIKKNDLPKSLLDKYGEHISEA